MENNEPNNKNRIKSQSCRSSSSQNNTPSKQKFEFKSSLFTEKSRKLLEKLVSQSLSGDNSFSTNSKTKQIKNTKKSNSISIRKRNYPKTLNNSENSS